MHCHIQAHTVVGLVETHTHPLSDILVEGYTVFHNPRRRDPSLTNKLSGGVAVLVRDTLAKSIQPLTPHPEDSLWLKIQGRAVGMEQDFALGIVYVPPNVPLERVPFGPLRQGIAQVPTGMPCYILGDLNARTGNYSPPPDVTPFQHVACILEDDMEVDYAPQRQLQDQGRNPYGRELVRLTDMSNMVILNGTNLDATHGAYTCYTQPLSPSTIDLALTSRSLHHTIQEMRTLPYLPDITDHCAISLTTTLPITTPPPNRIRASLDTSKVVFKRPRWNEDAKTRVTLDLSTPEVKMACHNILQQPTSTEGRRNRSFDQAVTGINRIISQATENQCRITTRQVPPGKDRLDGQANSIDQPWFDEKCDRAKRAMRDMAEACHRQKIPLPPRYFGLRTHYKRVIASTEARYKETIRDKMAEQRTKAPRAWWALLRQLNNTKPEKILSPVIAPGQWQTHFQNLLTGAEQPRVTLPVPRANQVPFLTTTEEVLRMYKANSHYNGPVGVDEVNRAIQKLNNHKAVFFDNISNEAIKCFHRAQQTVLPILFSKILQSGSYPAEWSRSYLTPLYKKGPVDAPANYRGIAISPCLGKTFNAIINQRLAGVMETNGVSNDVQIGFEKDHRIADHILVLNTILDQAKFRKQDVFLAFIDLKQAYDRINRKQLYSKLLDLGFPSKIISIIINQYDKVQYCILTPEGRTRFFKAAQGLKQGDPMSPRLFNIFFMDIILIFDLVCDPFYINGRAIYVLLFADDLVLISASHYGLQQALNKLSAYCMEWNLTVNTDKTKVMHVVRRDKGLETPPPLLYNGVELEWVTGFNYLGVYLDTSGRIQPKGAPIVLKAHRAQFKLSRMVRTLPFDTKMWLHQTMVDPILLHGTEIWSCQDRDKLIRDHGLYNTEIRAVNPSSGYPMLVEYYSPDSCPSAHHRRGRPPPQSRRSRETQE